MMISVSIRGRKIAKADSSNRGSWLGDYDTILLEHDIVVMRVHMGAGEGAATRKDLVTGSGAVGSPWYAVGDVVLSRSDYIRSRALPADGFTEADMWVIRAGSKVNVGRCSRVSWKPGGGEQVEFLSGPPPLRKPIDAWWGDQYGHA